MGSYYGRPVTSSEEEQMQEDEDKKYDKEEDTSKATATNKKKQINNTEEVNIRVTLPYKPKGVMFGVAETFQGGSRLQLICEDGERRMGRIPGKL